MEAHESSNSTDVIYLDLHKLTKCLVLFHTLSFSTNFIFMELLVSYRSSLNLKF